MFSEAKVTEIYCMTHVFCIESSQIQKKYIVEETILNNPCAAPLIIPLPTRSLS